MLIFNAVQSVLTIAVMMSMGYYLTARGWLDEKVSELFSKLVVQVSLPAFMISNMLSTFDRSKLAEFGLGLIFPFAAMILSYILSMVVSRMLRLTPERRGVFQSMFALSNTIFIGLPVNVALFGEESIPYVLLYYFANTTIFWTVGVYAVRQDVQSGVRKFFDVRNLKKIFSPPLVTFIISIIFILLGITPPKFIMDASRYLGNLTTPLSMLFMGIIIRSIDLHRVKLDREAAVLLLGRFVVSPLLVALFLSYSSIPVLMKKVFVIESAMPVMTQIAIVARAYGADHGYATVMAVISTVASMVFIPLYMVLINMSWF
jgi:hypothetical protein